MADPKINDPKRTVGAPPSHIYIEKKPVNWLAWILLGLGILALLLGLSRCDRHQAVSTETVTTTTPAVVHPTEPAGTVVAATTGASVGQLESYLAGSDATPRTFAFDNMHFDTAMSTLRNEDQATVDQVGALLGPYNKTRVRIVGYADARGSAPANAKLGRDRAESVKAALVAKGVDAGRIDTASGGESDAIATNATASGEAENRRTELVVLNR